MNKINVRQLNIGFGYDNVSQMEVNKINVRQLNIGFSYDNVYQMEVKLLLEELSASHAFTEHYQKKELDFKIHLFLIFFSFFILVWNWPLS